MFKKIFGVASCKGGVGKSTIAINLAISLSKFFNKKIGLLDADMHGPSHPTLLGISETKNMESKFFEPEKKYNISSMSIGYFIKENSSVLLRGPMISNTLNFLIKNTAWNNIDILIIDFPPGTGDVYLSLLRDLKIDGMLIISTPQVISTIDVKKTLIMLNKFNVKIFGLLENMKYYTCDKCKTKNEMYDNNDTSITNLINEFNIKKTYSLDFDYEISKSCSQGKPFMWYKTEETDSTKTIKNISLDIIKHILE
ncbi:MAG TPA: P-loop NTPase [Candidatus Azoamicus sp.]